MPCLGWGIKEKENVRNTGKYDVNAGLGNRRICILNWWVYFVLRSSRELGNVTEGNFLFVHLLFVSVLF